MYLWEAIIDFFSPVSSFFSLPEAVDACYWCFFTSVLLGSGIIQNIKETVLIKLAGFSNYYKIIYNAGWFAK